jgi:hypothetical protein
MTARQVMEPAESNKYINVEMSRGLAKVTFNNQNVLNCVNIEIVHELVA